MADKIHQRIDEIKFADSVSFLIQHGIGRCHSLVGNKKTQYAMDLIHPYRLVFVKVNTSEIEVEIIKIEDYH